MSRPVPEFEYYFAKDVAAIMGISERKAYDIIREFNEELQELGTYIIPGRIRKSYFHRRTDIVNTEPVPPRRARAVRSAT